jgi:hypothetical protein
MDSFCMPNIEVSWDDGATWMPYGNCISEGMLARILGSDGTVLWSGHAESYVETCGACDGKGKSRRLRFVAEKPKESGNERPTVSGHE